MTLAVAYVVAVVAVARATRLVTSDPWPPIAALRERWKARTAPRGEDGQPLRDAKGRLVEGPWTPLLTCPFCAAPYIAAVTLATAYAADVWHPDLHTLAGWWWLLAAWASLSYLASMLVVRDEPAPVYEDDEA